MSSKRRPLRYVITSALLIGPAVSCGPDVQTNPVAPIEESPTGNPVEPEVIEEPMEPEAVEDDTETTPTDTSSEGQPEGTPVGPTNEAGIGTVRPPTSVPTPFAEPRPRVNTRRPPRTRRPVQPEPTPNLRAPQAPGDEAE